VKIPANFDTPDGKIDSHQSRGRIGSLNHAEENVSFSMELACCFTCIDGRLQ
jgi:hypothetical protein